MAEKKQRKERVVFTLNKDVLLLRSALGYNPWQMGDEFWKEVVKDMRTVKCRVDLLVDKFKKNQLKYLSGTEELSTERGKLIEAIIAIKEEESAAINTQVTPEDEVGDSNEVGTVEVPTSTETVPKNTVKERKLERLVADKERLTYMDEAAGPSGFRGKRQRLSVEEEVMMDRHQHDMAMEKEKLEIDKLRVQSEQSREQQRLRLEQQREERLNEESKRRDEIAKSQIQLQTAMMEIMKKFVEK